MSVHNVSATTAQEARKLFPAAAILRPTVDGFLAFDRIEDAFDHPTTPLKRQDFRKGSR